MLLLGAASASATTFTVTNGNNTGTGSLRAAITAAETNGNGSTVDQIQINFIGNIDLDSALQISTPMTITGSGVNSVNVRRNPVTLSGQFRLFAITPAAGNTVTLQNLTISGARANNFAGAAIIMSGLGNLVLNTAHLTDNRALSGAGQGGAIYYDRGFTSIRNSTLSGNQADFGGAIRGSSTGADNGLGELINTTIAGNSATDFGGGIDIDQKARITVNSSTIVGNTADADNNASGNGGGLLNNSTGTAPVFGVANTILAGNAIGTTSPVAEQCRGTFVSDDYNLRTTTDGSCTGFTGTHDLVNATPLLGSLMVNVTGPPTIALLPGSPAINAGNPATPADSAYPACPTTDERSLPRGAGGNLCDIGAFEVQRNTTTTAVSCAPTSLTLGTGSTTCTATVTDTGSSTSPPTGSVSFSSDGAGTFSGAGSCTLGSPSSSQASCQLNYTPTASGTGSHQITGAYGGDADHDVSQGAAQVGVLSPAGTAPIPPATGQRAAALRKCKKKPKGPKRKKCIKRAKRLPV